MYYDPFVLPFTVSMLVLFIYLAFRYGYWVLKLEKTDQHKIFSGFFSCKSLKAMREIVFEGLLHRKIFKVNTRLGYMHMSLAFGWFLLIVVGAIEAHTFVRGSAPFYFPIFFRFFVPGNHEFFLSGIFKQVMDFLLLFVLSGLTLAVLKRINSLWIGQKRTSRKKPIDRLVLTALWLIFPLRFFAESFTSGIYQSGGFLTGTAGAFFSNFLPINQWAYPAWWAYSCALALFFTGLPFTRYMHIPTEIVFIFFRHWGIKLRVDNPVMSDIEIHSCPKCGICIDTCQLSTMAGIHNTQSVYFIQKLRNREKNNHLANSCLMCGRCESVCPVSIDLNALRLMNRPEVLITQTPGFGFIPELSKKADIIYFAGCMTHLTPTIKNAMVKILNASGDNYWFFDKDQGACCGRPLKLAGQTQASIELVDRNRQMMIHSGARMLVTSCPICYKTFANDYHLGMEVLHHSQYIDRLITNNQIEVKKMEETAVYHDPCELGRGSGVYGEPRSVLQKVVELKGVSFEKCNALCCGGSIAHVTLPMAEKKQIARETLRIYSIEKPNYISTGCPLCKKTFSYETEIQIADIAELVAKALVCKPINKSVKTIQEPICQ